MAQSQKSHKGEKTQDHLHHGRSTVTREIPKSVTRETGPGPLMEQRKQKAAALRRKPLNSSREVGRGMMIQNPGTSTEPSRKDT